MEDWTPEPLVAAPTPFEELDNEKRPVIVGYDARSAGACSANPSADLQGPSRSSPTVALSRTLPR